MRKFEDRLFDELMQEHGAELSASPAHRTRRVARPVWLSGGVLAAAGVTAGGLVMFGGGAAPAFAVTQNANGTVGIAVHDTSGIAGANAKLHSLGDSNVVIVPVGPGCEPASSLPRVTGLQGRTIGGGSSDINGQVTVNVTGIPAGDIAVVAYQHIGRTGQMLVAITTPPAPACLSLPAPPSNPNPTATSGSLSSPPPTTGG
jgi:hypothetical protein